MPALISPRITLYQPEWIAREQQHILLIDEWVKPHQKRASIHEKHPVYDFLFDYYSFRPSLLRRWQPGIGIFLAGSQAEKFLARKGYLKTANGITLNPDLRTPKRLRTIQWIGDCLRNCHRRPPQFACYGL
ncbi:MAG: hypothetical protein JKY51_00460, partial [Opitutaceae bacterium]|nr:hypothetical protein [Opitutaceae bacterium]